MPTHSACSPGDLSPFADSAVQTGQPIHTLTLTSAKLRGARTSPDSSSSTAVGHLCATGGPVPPLVSRDHLLFPETDVPVFSSA